MAGSAHLLGPCLARDTASSWDGRRDRAYRPDDIRWRGVQAPVILPRIRRPTGGVLAETARGWRILEPNSTTPSTSLLRESARSRTCDENAWRPWGRRRALCCSRQQLLSTIETSRHQQPNHRGIAASPGPIEPTQRLVCDRQDRAIELCRACASSTVDIDSA